MYYDLKETYWWYGMKRDIISILLFVIPVSESRPSINDYRTITAIVRTRVKVGRDWYGFRRGIA
jgi:hypothetical protein